MYHLLSGPRSSPGRRARNLLGVSSSGAGWKRGRYRVTGWTGYLSFPRQLRQLYIPWEATGASDCTEGSLEGCVAGLQVGSIAVLRLKGSEMQFVELSGYNGSLSISVCQNL